MTGDFNKTKMATEAIGRGLNAYFGNNTPAEFIYEDEQCVVLEEQDNRQAPVHFIVIPRKHIPTLCKVTEEHEKLLGHLLNVARRIANVKGLNDSGYRVVVNEGAHGGQTVDQFHVHVFGGRQMLWPFG